MKDLYNQIAKEKRRIDMLKNSKSNGDPSWYDFVNDEIKKAKNKIKKLQNEMGKKYQNEVLTR